MKELLIILVSSAIVNNVVLSQFLGLCPFLGVSKSVETAAGMGGAIIFVITLSSFCDRYYLQCYPGSYEPDLSADYRIHPADRGAGTVCRDVS